jgi:predicted outer membrane protein
MLSQKSLVAGVTAICFSGLVCFADDPVTTGTAKDNQAVTTIISPAQNDAQILKWVKIDCDAITKCAKGATSQITNTEVKTLADKIVSDHETMKNMIKEKCKNMPADKSEDKHTVATLIKDDGATRDNRAVYSPCDFVAVKQKVCNHMMSVGEKEMKKLKGEEFDKAFLVHMGMAHEAALASIAEVRGSASKELAECLDSAKETMTAHLNSAKELCKANHEKTAQR